MSVVRAGGSNRIANNTSLEMSRSVLAPFVTRRAPSCIRRGKAGVHVPRRSAPSSIPLHTRKSHHHYAAELRSEEAPFFEVLRFWRKYLELWKMGASAMGGFRTFAKAGSNGEVAP